MKWIVAITLSILAICGCGGSGSSGATTRQTRAILSIAWRARTRVNAPSSALSATITYSRGGVAVQPAFTINRSTAVLTDYFNDYTSPDAMEPGPLTLHIDFFSQAGGLGIVTGQVHTGAILATNGQLQRSNGQPLDTVLTEGKIASVSINPVSPVSVGSTTTLTATAYDASSAVIAVSPGSFSFQSSFGGLDAATIASNGDLTGVVPGVINVTANADGVTSPPIAVTIQLSPTGNFRFIPISANAMVYRSADGLLYVTTTDTSPNHPNKVAAIDPSNGNVVAEAFVFSQPDRICLSSDGQRLYVSSAVTGEIARLSLPSLASDFVIPGRTSKTDLLVPSDLKALPGNPTSVVAAYRNSFDDGPLVFDDAVARPTGPSSFVPNKIAVSDDGLTLFGTETEVSPGTYQTYSIAPGGLTSLYVSPDRGVLDGSQTLEYDQGRVYGGLRVAAAATGLPVGLFSLDSFESAVATTLDRPAHRFFVASGGFNGPSTVLAFATDTFTRVASVTLPYPLDQGSMVRYGATGLALGVTDVATNSPGILLIKVAPGL